MGTEVNALEGPISKCKQNLRNYSSPSGGPRYKPLKLSKNPPRGPSPCSAVWGILGPKLEIVNQSSCVCIGVGLDNLGQNTPKCWALAILGTTPPSPLPTWADTLSPPTQADPQSPPHPPQLGTGPHTVPWARWTLPPSLASQGMEGGFGRTHSHGGPRAPCPGEHLVTGRGLCP